MRKHHTAIIALGFLALVVLWSGCAALTGYPPEVARDSPYFGRINKDEAVQIILKKASPDGARVDSGSFLADPEGFSFKKSQKKTATETRNRKPVQMEYLEVTTRNVPWREVIGIRPFHKEVPVLGRVYIVTLEYRFSSLDSYGRRLDVEELDFYCGGSYERFVDTVAALRTLTHR
jgi:hypothetical protein